MVMKSKKAISPVVATALLLVVAVLAVVSFQTWFNSYQSGLNVQVENQSSNNRPVSIEGLEGTTNAVVYLRNPNSQPMSVSQVRLVSSGNTVCDNTTAFSVPANNVALTSVGACSLTTGSVYEVVVVTPGGVTRQSQIAR